MKKAITLELIYETIKNIDKRLQKIENILEELILRNIPEVEVNEDTSKEIDNSIKEMDKGDYVTLEDLKNA